MVWCHVRALWRGASPGPGQSREGSQSKERVVLEARGRGRGADLCTCSYHCSLFSACSLSWLQVSAEKCFLTTHLKQRSQELSCAQNTDTQMVFCSCFPCLECQLCRGAEVVALLLVMFTWCLETRTWQIVALLNGVRRGKVVQAKGAARQGRGRHRRPGGRETWGMGGGG